MPTTVPARPCLPRLKSTQMKKPVTPQTHGIIDYVFSTVQLALPSALGLPKRAAKTYGALGAGFLAINAITDTPVAVKPLLSFKTHQRLDAAFLIGQAAMAFLPPVRKNKKTLAFHLAFLATAVTHYVLTDYGAGAVQDKPKVSAQTNNF